MSEQIRWDSELPTPPVSTSFPSDVVAAVPQIAAPSGAPVAFPSALPTGAPDILDAPLPVITRMGEVRNPVHQPVAARDHLANVHAEPGDAA